MTESPQGPVDGSAERDAFKIWTAGQPNSPTYKGLVGATLKLGPRVCKTVSIAKYGEAATEKVKKRVLKVAKYERLSNGRFDYRSPAATWTAEDGEIELLLAFLNEEVDQPGRYRVVDTTSPTGELLSLLDGKPDALPKMIETHAASAGPEAIGTALAQSPAGLTGAEAAVIAGRRSLIETAAAAAESPSSTETDLQRLIGGAWWMFGGRYVGVLPRRQLLQLDEHDIPLVCADGSLHIVELKGPVVSSLIKRHRNHWIVGNEVHEATMQATNYIRTADELGASAQRNLRDELGIDVDLRRVFATVVIGHRRHVVAPGMPPEQFDIAMRTYNATLNRVQLLTYDQLLDAAERSLVFDGV